MLNNFNSKTVAVVFGSSGGVGKAMVEHLADLSNVSKIYSFSRSKVSFKDSKIFSSSIDIEDENSIIEAAKIVNEKIHLVIVATGFLHDENIKPEKNIKEISFDSFNKNFAINTIGPAIIAKNFLPLMEKNSRSLFAILSARVGSISDNSLGGWYAYRSSKAAINMIIKNFAIEMKRVNPNLAIIGLHPGTVKTRLSEPFAKNTKHDLFEPGYSAKKLLEVVNLRGVSDSGKIFDWNNIEISA
jgi:NAD(P)-dependent dehydrogenase (short-subunit alcohol dehydrogenase family)